MFTDKVIDIETVNKIRRVIEMTKIAQIFEEEKIAYGEKMAKEAAEKATEKATEETTKTIVENLLKDGMFPEKIVQIVSNITLEEVKLLENKLLKTI